MDFGIIFWIIAALLFIMIATGFIHNSFPTFANNQIGSMIVSIGDGAWKFLGYNMVKTQSATVQVNVPVNNPTNTTVSVTGSGY